jgi:hypothetical protein
MARQASLRRWASVQTLARAILACDSHHAEARTFLRIADRELGTAPTSAAVRGRTPPAVPTEDRQARPQARIVLQAIVVGVLFVVLIATVRVGLVVGTAIFIWDGLLLAAIALAVSTLRSWRASRVVGVANEDRSAAFTEPHRGAATETYQQTQEVNRHVPLAERVAAGERYVPGSKLTPWAIVAAAVSRGVIGLLLLPLQVVLNIAWSVISLLTLGFSALITSIAFAIPWMLLVALLAGTSWLWLRVPQLRGILLVPSVLIVTIANQYLLFAPDDPDARDAKFELVEAWPLTWPLLRPTSLASPDLNRQ